MLVISTVVENLSKVPYATNGKGSMLLRCQDQAPALMCFPLTSLLVDCYGPSYLFGCQVDIPIDTALCKEDH